MPRGQCPTGQGRAVPRGTGWATQDPAFLASAAEGADVVFECLSPLGGIAGRLEGVVDQLIPLAAERLVLPQPRAGVRRLRAGRGDGRSFISCADLAKAVVDEIERPAHRRARFHVAY